ncbi:MAG TPA: PqqD family protein [Terriglobales bacterium]|nr:PqqD family protein [Terriglobales bacterium]
MSYALSQNLRIVSTGEQMIIMDVKQGKFYTCNQIGATIVNLLRSGHTLDSIAETLEEQSKQSHNRIKNDILLFMQTLVQKNLCHVS